MKTKDEMCATCKYAENFDPVNDLIYCTETGDKHLSDFWCTKYEYYHYY